MTMIADRTHSELSQYYGSPWVRERIDQFCGAGGLGGLPSALDLAGYGGTRWLHEQEGGPVRRSLQSLASLVEQGADVYRSLADREGTLLGLDLLYAHPSDPYEPYREPARCFDRIENVHREVLAALARGGVRPLVLMSGRGYHYLFRAPAGSPFRRALVALGARRAYGSPEGGAVASDEQRAHDGAGRLLELLVHDVLRAASPLATVPLRLAEVPPPGGGPFACLDLSAYADGVEDAHVRCAFSSDQKALLMRPGCASPSVFVLPVGERPFRELLDVRADPRAASLHAQACSAAIPDVPEAAAWLREYSGSGLAFFHAQFDATSEPERMRHEGDPFDADALPPCASLPLRFPNPWLLHPRHLRTVALVLWSMGWHPRSIAALVRSRYEQDHDWGTLWQRHDAATRATFHARLFCGAAAEGLEDGAFSCGTQAQNGLCRSDACGYDLEPMFRSLRSRRARAEAHA
jgi:hypothetical protein